MTENMENKIKEVTKITATQAREATDKYLREHDAKKNEEELNSVYLAVAEASSQGRRKTKIDHVLSQWTIDKLKEDGYKINYIFDSIADIFWYDSIWKTAKTLVEW